jgi:hypothetical protein
VNAKIQQLTRLVIRPAQWSDRFNDMAKGIPHDEPCELAAVLAEKVSRGAASVAELVTPSGVVGFLVYAFAFGGRELVLIACHGRDGTNLAGEIREHVETFARRKGCSSVRFHTMRPGLVRRAVASGYHVGEIILRKNLS